ncbi:MAG: prolyl-tRNA synthetase associated domain-containing protein [Gemmatimonadales bacterium]|nr:prolyl-tRNA synthetase associated domain-containing protein [Gemmatimonadales bacterium]
MEHQAVYTVEQAKEVRGGIEGCHTKNLFLRNKKGTMWLVTCLADRAVDLRWLGEHIGAGRLSFGSAQRLMKYLGVLPGAVSPFAVVNDRQRKVRVVLDREVLEQEPVNFHPLDNRMTVTIGAQDFLRFLDAERHTPQIINFG